MSDYRKALPALRKKLDWSQEELARYLNVSASSVHNWENLEHWPLRFCKERILALLRDNHISLEDNSET